MELLTTCKLKIHNIEFYIFLVSEFGSSIVGQNENLSKEKPNNKICSFCLQVLISSNRTWNSNFQLIRT